MRGCGRDERTERMDGGRVAETRALPPGRVGVVGSCPTESDDGESSACVVNLVTVSTRGRSGREWEGWGAAVMAEGGTGGKGDMSLRGVVLGIGSISCCCAGSLGLGGISSSSAGVAAPLSLDTHSSSSPPASTWRITVRFGGGEVPFV